jgi:hypothetical protein
LDSSAKPKREAPIVGFHDVASPLGPGFDCDDSGGEYRIAVELGLSCTRLTFVDLTVGDGDGEFDELYGQFGVRRPANLAQIASVTSPLPPTKKTEPKKKETKVVGVKSKKCEGCGLKQPAYGLPAEGKRRWCAGCAKAHAGAVDVKSKKCEGCGLKQPVFGLPAEGKRRWCAGCAKAHAGAVDAKSKKCEGCGLKQPAYGLPAEGKIRWCAGCAKAHAGAVDAKTKKPYPPYPPVTYQIRR